MKSSSIQCLQVGNILPYDCPKLPIQLSGHESAARQEGKILDAAVKHCVLEAGLEISPGQFDPYDFKLDDKRIVDSKLVTANTLTVSDRETKFAGELRRREDGSCWYAAIFVKDEAGWMFVGFLPQQEHRGLFGPGELNDAKEPTSFVKLSLIEDLLLDEV